MNDIDLVVRNPTELLQQIDGRTVELAGGLSYPGSRASTAPAELACTAGAVPLTCANVAVAQIRGLLRRLRVLMLERRETVLGKGRHTGVIGRPQLALVEPG